ncbi:MAG: radical SAM protein [Candidatus Omnitrophota bacterium]
MTDVILIYPSPYKRGIYTKIKTIDNIPISIWYLGSYLKSKGMGVILIDFEGDPDALERLGSIGKDSLLIGITMMTAQINHGLGIARFIKEKIGDIPIVVGGVHPTLYPTETVRSQYIDFTVQGEGEIALFELISGIKRDERDYSKIGGLSYKVKEKIFFNKEKSKLVDHFNYPDLDYGLLGQKRTSLVLVTSRGCPYDCAFCCNKAIMERRTFQTWSLQKIMHEVKRALDLGVTDIFFWDDNFFQKKQRLIGFLEEIKKLDKKFTWFGNTRADYFNERYISIELLSELNKYGLTRVSIGAESGSQRMLDYMQKGTKVEHIFKAAEYCVKANIAPSFPL